MVASGIQGAGSPPVAGRVPPRVSSLGGFASGAAAGVGSAAAWSQIGAVTTS